MHKELPGIELPEDHDVLWRFMSFEKFVNILVKESLFFTRSDKFEDPFEGSIPPQVEPVVEPVENFGRYILCNCWHHSEPKSMLMWERYRLHNRGIAIKTTMGNLKKSLPKSPHMFIGRVNYTDQYEFEVPQDISEINKMYTRGFHRYFHKREVYRAEREVRIIVDTHQFISDHSPQDICEIGQYHKFDLKTLINEVVTSPYTRKEKWITETVKSVVHKYGFNFPVSISRLLG